MDGNQEGGVCTQKVTLFTLIGAVAIAAAFGLVIVSDDASAMSYDLSGADFAEVESSVTYTLSFEDAPENAKYAAKLVDSDGDEMTSAISSGSSGTLSSSSKSITVKAPKDAGNYRLIVTITDADGKEIEKLVAPLKAVDPIVLSVTLNNGYSAERELIVYFVINGVKVEDSRQEITVPANGSKEITYDYVVKNVSDTTFYLVTDDSTLGGQISGLGPEHSHTFYVEQNSYTFIEVTAVIVLLIVIFLMIWVYRKPVKNFGKPKARR